MNSSDEERLINYNLKRIKEYALINLNSKLKKIIINYNQNGEIIFAPCNKDIIQGSSNFYELKIIIKQDEYFWITTIEKKKKKLPKESFETAFKKFTKIKNKTMEELIKQEEIIEQFNKKENPDKIIYSSIIKFNKEQKTNYEKSLQETKIMGASSLQNNQETDIYIAQGDIATPKKIDVSELYPEELN